jgi:hypothetical protein
MGRLEPSYPSRSFPRALPRRKSDELVYGYTHIQSDTSLWSLFRPDSVLGLLGEKQINRLGK